jgi:tRNA-modifying protein YgfZ
MAPLPALEPMSTWSAFLSERGAAFEGAAVAHFGDAAGERVAARDAAVLYDLAPVAALAVTGPDSAAFLQGQVTNDVTALADGAVQLSAWCSPKGRVLTNFLLRRIAGDHFELLLPSSLGEPIAKRLRMFVLRSKVAIADASGATVRLGVGGPAAAACIVATIGMTPALHHAMTIDGGTLVALPGNRFLMIAAPEHAPTLWQTLTRARPAGIGCWEWLTIRAAVPVITPPTQDAFIPQMLNLDALEAIAFGKGCYAGQEIVARAQYLGRLKERLSLVHVDAEPPAAGARLFSPAFGDQPCGTVVNAAAAPGGGADALAVVQTAATAGDALRLDAPDGMPAVLLPLPYALPAARDPAGRIA